MVLWNLQWIKKEYAAGNNPPIKKIMIGYIQIKVSAIRKVFGKPTDKLLHRWDISIVGEKSTILSTKFVNSTMKSIQAYNTIRTI